MALPTDPSADDAEGPGAFLWSVLAGVDWREQTVSRRLANGAVIVVPLLLTTVLLVGLATGILLPTPAPTLLEQIATATQDRADVAWKTSVPCWSCIEYYADLAQTKRTAVEGPATEFRQVLTGLAPGTTHYCRCVLQPTADCPPDQAVHSREFEVTTAQSLRFSVIKPSCGATTMTVEWRTNLSCGTTLFYGPTAECPFVVDLEGALPTLDHRVEVSGLLRDTPYFFRLGAPDRAERSDLQTARTLAHEPEPEKQKSPLEQLAESYIEKLGRMTPDERTKLNDSLNNYLLLKPGKALSAARKAELATTASTVDTFNDRLALFTAWRNQLSDIGCPIDRDETEQRNGVMLSTFEVNKRRACTLLDCGLAELAEAEHLVTGR